MEFLLVKGAREMLERYVRGDAQLSRGNQRPILHEGRIWQFADRQVAVCIVAYVGGLTPFLFDESLNRSWLLMQHFVGQDPAASGKPSAWKVAVGSAYLGFKVPDGSFDSDLSQAWKVAFVEAIRGLLEETKGVFSNLETVHDIGTGKRGIQTN